MMMKKIFLLTYTFSIVLFFLSTGSFSQSIQPCKKTQTTTWLGLFSTYWNTAGNWVGNTVPLASDDVIIPTGRAFYPILQEGEIVECRNIIIQTGASVIINKNCFLPVEPSVGTLFPSQNQIDWNWIGVTGATGYKWNTNNDCSTAIDLGAATSRSETGLTCNTSYTRYVWAFNECGHSTPLTMNQGTSACSFACGQLLTDARDGKTYNTVLAGTQCWMAQNLNVGTKILGATNQTNNSITEKYCYNNDDANCAIYGGLYSWDEMMQYGGSESAQGICPAGWHIPSDAEWTTLTTYLGALPGGKMKEAGTAHWKSPNTGATNSSGFTALPGGDRYAAGYFNNSPGWGYIWSTTQFNTTSAWYRRFQYNDANVSRYNTTKPFGLSVRCVMN